MTSLPVRKVLVGIALGVAGAAIAAAAARTSFFAALENASYDRRVLYTADRASAGLPVVIVEINDFSIQALEPVVGRWPWPRMVHAAVIDYLKRAGAKVIAYDVLFGEREGHSTVVVNGREINGEESDEAFVDSVRNAGNVVLLADAVSNGLADAPVAPAPELPGVVFRPGPGFQARPVVTLPFPELAGVARGVGHNFFVKDANTDSARRMLPFIDSHGVVIPSLGVAGALAFANVSDSDVRLEGHDLRLGAVKMPVLRDPVPTTGEVSTQALVRFTAPYRDTNVQTTSIFPTYSFFDVALSADNVLSGKAPAIPMSAFAGKLVFVGTTAAGLHDQYSSPFKAGIAGVELHATLAHNILSGAFMRGAATSTDIAISVVSGIVAGLSATLLPVAIATVATAALVAGLAFWLAREVGHGIWVALVMPSAAAAIALFGGVAWRYFVEDRAKRHIRHLFGRYVSGDVINELMANPALAKLGGQKREMTVLFSDIRGFTTASEASTPEAVVAQLNEYFGAMVEVLFRHQGTLDKFVGDMVMGLFGAPLPDARHADHAVETALGMIARLEALNVKWKDEGRPQLNIGIGINSGEMIAGNIGAESAMSYTVIGDAVNLGSRLESLNKDYGTRILISDATRSRLTIPVATRFIGDVKVKGKTHAVPVYEVTGTKEHEA